MKRLTSFALVTGLALFHATSAHAQEREQEAPPPPETHRSVAAYGAGIALTSVGSLVVAGGLFCGVGGLVMLGQPVTGDTNMTPLFALMGGAIWLASVAAGVPMLVGGIVLIVKNAPPKREPVFNEARSDAPRFTSIPILSGTF